MPVGRDDRSDRASLGVFRALYTSLGPSNLGERGLLSPKTALRPASLVGCVCRCVWCCVNVVVCVRVPFRLRTSYRPLAV